MDIKKWYQNDRKDAFTDLQSTSDVLGTFNSNPIHRKIEAGHRPVVGEVSGGILEISRDLHALGEEGSNHDSPGYAEALPAEVSASH